ncbi:hypothetical protein CCACVL1_13959 [Corchorus capsularis]|uniref:Uncharacterized protein n=1 Tax=Corchorus capsularis TaxID=210143 RepID=A0A1R3I8U3_COCAP|nr:hypothetical protein CCACVL1_13959 [Corchorus capsularis]
MAAAKNNPILACVFVIILVSSYGIRLSEEARLLKFEKVDIEDSGNRVTRSSSHNYGGKHEDAPTVSGNLVTEEYDTEDLHPTSPGHSPSIGHSTGPATHDHN